MVALQGPFPEIVFQLLTGSHVSMDEWYVVGMILVEKLQQRFDR